ncbi:hypothetical protein [Paenibacillus sp. YYML68]|uniref:DUF7667 family protein n=1 Tax=Paenibacillus sp. YYML68 TaxID=2909250 RepID=UPI00249314A3|nr:hypothetical protein [Paenibacillus sp. YYML68]
MLTVHWRLAELWTTQQGRELTEQEKAEWSACLHYNAVYARKLSALYNLSWAAYATRDVEWQHEICERIERLEHDGQLK